MSRAAMVRTPSCALAAALLISAAASAHRNGAQGGFNNSIASFGGTCMGCHGDSPGSGFAQLSGAPASYEPGVIYDLTIRVEDPVQAAAGFQLSVEDSGGDHVGTLIITDPVNTKTAQGPSGWVTHTEAGVDDAAATWAAMGNAAEFHVAWQSPAEDIGPLTFYVAGNAINNDETSDGDLVYFTTATIEAGGACPGDATGDGSVDVGDLVAVILAWGACSPSCPEDTNGDEQVDVQDLIAVITAWGPC
ncbi:MAG: choice-of-anchor V domain-containing protein [Planctomycetota bacterium]